MIRNKLKKTSAFSLILLSALLAGCSSDKTADTAGSQTQAENSTQTNTTEQSEGAESTKEKADLENLAANGIFNVSWHTQDGDYTSGTSFLIDSEVHGEKLIVSAFHYLWPDDADTFTGAELPDYVTGGEIYQAYDFSATGATLKNCLIIEDADAVPATDKDVSAFTIQGNDDLMTLPLATEMPETGDSIYLLANLWDTDDIHENCIYEGEFMYEENGVFYYELDSKYGTTGASGAPIVNEYGEVLAIHIGSNGSIRVAHTASSFMEQINKGTVSDITYSSEFSTEDTASSDSKYLSFAREDYVESMFYNVQLDGVTFTDTLEGQAAETGYQYAIIDLSLNANESISEPVYMNYANFVLDWTDDYSFPLEAGYSDNQLPDEYTLTQDITSGQLIFLVPTDVTEVYFAFIDYYYTEDSEDVQYGDYYEITLPVENWTR